MGSGVANKQRLPSGASQSEVITVNATHDRLSPEEINRYSRHLTLPEVGLAGQQKIKNAKVLMIGAGGLGSPIGIYLAAAGVGRIGVVDFDKVDASNLQRQVAHSTADLGRPKVESIRDRMRAINPYVEVEAHEEKLTAENAQGLFERYDVIVDGSDNFQTRYLVNDAAYFAGKPLVYGSIFRFEGQISVFDPHSGGPCYRCLYSNPPPASLVPS
jgi:adenylyltransferase/sulfurtransferase